MLPKALRLPSSQKLQSPKRISASIFVLSFVSNNLPNNRYGFIVGKKIDKRAVARNRLKRILRSCIEELHSSLPQGKDMLFFVQKNFTEMKREEVMQKVKEVLL